MSTAAKAWAPLITAEQLQALLQQTPPPLLLDCSFDLADSGAGERAFLDRHIAGARYAHLERELSAPKSPEGSIRGGRHPLPTREAFAETVASWGLTPERGVVCYDQQGGPYAARAWWMLRWLGQGAVAVLDGGLAAWQAAGGRVESGEAAPAPPASSYPLGDTTMPTVQADTLLRQLGQVTVLDARAGERFRGETEPLDAVAGHIPGALNRFFKDNLGPDGRFLPADTLRATFEAMGLKAGQLVNQCGSGVTACHNLLALEHAGLTGSALYPGSWSEWSADPARPVARS